MANVIIRTNVLSITHEDQEIKGLRFNVTPGLEGIYFIAIEGEQLAIDEYVTRVNGELSSQEELDEYLESLPNQEIIDSYPTDLELAKKQHLQSLALACDNAVYDGFESSVIRDEIALEFWFNEKHQNDFLQQTSIVLANGGFEVYDKPIQWRTKNKGIVTLTNDEYVTVINEAGAHKIAQQGKFWNLEVQVNDAESVEALVDIKW